MHLVHFGIYEGVYETVVCHAKCRPASGEESVSEDDIFPESGYAGEVRGWKWTGYSCLLVRNSEVARGQAI